MSTGEEACNPLTPICTDDGSGERDDDSRQLEDLLEEFYSFMYEKAVLVGPTGTSPSKKKSTRKTKPGSPTRVTSPTYEVQRIQISGGTSAASVQGSTSASTALTREIMDALLPPKTWQGAQGKWQRMVRMVPATRTETQQFQETFGHLLQQYQARAHAICPVREKFFLQVFEELIREVACECPERGLILLRIRDELRLTVEAYQTLYHNSISYGRQKAVQAEASVGEHEGVVSQLEAERKLLLAKKKELEHIAANLEDQNNEEEKKRQLRHAHTVQFLETQRQELELFHREMTQDPTWK